MALTDPIEVDIGAICVVTGLEYCEECVDASENVYRDENESARDLILGDLSEICNVNPSVAAVCIPRDECVDEEFECGAPKAYRGVDAELAIDDEESTVTVTFGQSTTGVLAASGALFIQGGQGPAVLAGYALLPNITFNGYAYSDSFLLVTADIELDPQGGGWFTVPITQENDSYFHTFQGATEKNYGVSLTEVGVGRILPSGTWFFNYESSESGYFVDVHLEGTWD